MNHLRVVALCGSLRKASINASLLRAFARLAPFTVDICPSLGLLPLFNPDLEAEPPEAVRAFHRLVASADALLIASPEYAHGMTGTLKNALDWLVGLEAFTGRPVAVLNASPRAYHADDALREVLRTMSAVLVGETSFALQLLGAKLDEDAMARSPEVATAVHAVTEALMAQLSRPPDVTKPGAISSTP